MDYKPAESIAEIVASGLCIGCGLCESISQRQVTMQMTESGSLRPSPVDGFNEETEKRLLSVCPGITIFPRQQANHSSAEPTSFKMDTVWGEYTSMKMAWAAKPDVRYTGSTGGVLTALARYLLSSKQVSFVYHVKADPLAPVQSIATISESLNELQSGTASRYGPVAPLTLFLEALDRNQPFAVVAKPCDLSAIHNLSKHDERVDQLVTHRLAMVCGGQSTGQKSRDVLKDAGMKEEAVTLYRHRGFGNPGPTRIECSDGRSLEISYQTLWEDESSWGIESRCKLCPDALGEAADIAAADVWSGGSPVGEEEGFNGVIVSSAVGEELTTNAVNSGELVIGDNITIDQFNDFQPHQVRKKTALKSRYQGLADAKCPVIQAPESRLNQLDDRLGPIKKEQEREGTARRFSRNCRDNCS